MSGRGQRSSLHTAESGPHLCPPPPSRYQDEELAGLQPARVVAWWRRQHVLLCLSRCSGPVALRDGARLSASCLSPRFGSFVHSFTPPPPPPITLPPLQITHQPRRSSPRYPQMATSCGPALRLAERLPNREQLGRG